MTQVKISSLYICLPYRPVGGSSNGNDIVSRKLSGIVYLVRDAAIYNEHESHPEQKIV